MIVRNKAIFESKLVKTNTLHDICDQPAGMIFEEKIKKKF